MKQHRELIFMLVLTTVCTLLLVGADLTSKAVAAADPVLMRRTMQMLPALGSASGSADVREAFQKLYRVVTIPAVKGSFFVSLTHPTVAVREAEGAGLWGKVTMLIAYDFQKETIMGATVLNHSETPGLGSRIEEPLFLKQFEGMPAPKGVKFAKIKFREGEFDGVTGATISSEAAGTIINSAISFIRAAAAAGAFK